MKLPAKCSTICHIGADCCCVPRAAMATGDMKLTMKLFIDTSAQVVLFAEVSADVAGILLSLLSLRCPQPPPKTFYKCSWTNDGKTLAYCEQSYYAEVSGTAFPECGSSMTKVMPMCGDKLQVSTTPLPPTAPTAGLTKGVTAYTVMYDLSIAPVTSVSALALLINKFGVSDLAALQERTVAIGINECLEILRASLLQSTTALTDLFLKRVQDISAQDASTDETSENNFIELGGKHAYGIDVQERDAQDCVSPLQKKMKTTTNFEASSAEASTHRTAQNNMINLENCFDLPNEKRFMTIIKERAGFLGASTNRNAQNSSCTPDYTSSMKRVCFADASTYKTSQNNPTKLDRLSRSDIRLAESVAEEDCVCPPKEKPKHAFKNDGRFEDALVHEEANEELGRNSTVNIESERVTFSSKHPWFLKTMTKAYVHGSRLRIPTSIVGRLGNEGMEVLLSDTNGKGTEVLLRDTTGNTWKARLNRDRINKGWSAFVEDNGIKLGDVCAFELVGANEIRVSIFKQNSDDKP